jgi:hypothetical protein
MEIINAEGIEFNHWYKLLSTIKHRYELMKSLNYGVVEFSDGKTYDLSLDKSLKIYEELIEELQKYQIEDAKI